MYLRLAWRNIWRNKKRTVITVSSVLFAVLLAIAFQSISIGTYDRLIQNVVSFYTGYIQIHKNGYADDKSLENTFKLDDALTSDLAEIEGLQGYVPRLESFALASFKKSTKGTMIVGIDPEKENTLTNLSSKLIDGNYLNSSDKGVLIAAGLADYLNLGVDDTLVLISQGYHGVNAAGKFSILGIVKFPSPDLNNQLVFLPLKEAQYFYGAEDLLTSLVLLPESAQNILAIKKRFKSIADMDYYEILDWKEMMPELIQQMELDRAGDFIFIMILYLIIAFGVFGTVLMMTSERTYEFGVLEAIGMTKPKLSWVVWMEVMMLAMLGVMVGITISFPILIYFYHHPVELGGEFAKVYEQYGFEPMLAFSLAPVVFLKQALIVFIIVLVISIYPLYFLNKLKVVKAIRH